jgi:hypothetical protein
MPKLKINNRLKSSLRVFYFKKGQKILYAIQQPVFDLAGNIEPSELKIRVPNILKGDPMRDYINEVWIKTGSVFAVDMIKRIGRLKKQEKDIDYWEDYFRLYTRERTLLKTKLIMDSQATVVNNMIDAILEEGYQNGLSMGEIQRTMRDKLIDGMTSINKYQAERIARTEVGGAATTASFESAKETGVVKGKEWLTKGTPDVRPTHQEYEAMGVVDMEYEYAPGLKHPLDPNGSAEEIINCRCDILFNTE